MAKVQVLDQTGKKTKEIDAPKEVFSYPVKDHLIFEAVVNYRSNQRRGTASTKTRGEVKGGGRKPWRQKGTGRARAGSTRSPIWRKGGVTFGPKPRDYTYRMPKKAKRNALKSALSLKFGENKILVLESLDFKEPRTKEGMKLLQDLKLESVLVVDSHENRNLFLSLRNIPKVKAIDHSQVNIYDVLNYESLVFTKKAFDSLMEKLK
ncbi:MAG: 50S ribosomal protein L4 [Candidatus Aminicenantes bacterium]|jgi:large subunit ribosomal protein L4|nr:50S ribosomal protein L4 [Candidatus Aminicenantes bacterium]MDH5743530.1 50S ribosomal protein L4 [Candidatus Aminicenantes bacterium]